MLERITGLIIVATAIIVVGCSEADPIEAVSGIPPTIAPGGPAPEATKVNKVNLNTATEEAFLTIPEVTAKMAREFDEYRPYASIRQFRREIGKYVDEAQVARYEQYVFVPIDINESDAETLEQIPGLNAMAAQAIVAARPYASAEVFMTTLGKYLDAETIEVARTYIGQ